MNARTLALLSLPLFLTVACVDDVGSGKTAAEVVEPTTQTQPVDGRSLAVDTSRSRLHALGAKVTATHDIVFDDWSGTLKVSGDEIVGIGATVQMSSLRADVDKLTAHLQSPDFFDVAQWPTAGFQSSQVTRQVGPDGATHQVTGELTLRGTTKAIAFPASVNVSGSDVTAEAEFVIDRRDFGVVYPGMPDDLIQDNVVLTIALTADRTDA